MTRSEYESYILTSVAAVMSKEQHKEFGGFLHSLSDDEFKSFVSEMGEKHGNTSLKEVMDLQQELQHSRNTLSCGYDNIPVFFLGEEENAAILESISHSRPANLILLDRDSDREIINLWRGKNETLTGIPSDLFFSGNIPLTDCRICVDRGNEVIKFRFVIYPDYAERIAMSDENNSATVGVMILDFDMGQIIQEIEVLKGYDWMMMNAAMGYRRLPKDFRDVISAKSTVSDFAGIFSELTATWYGIQIALLHPIVKDVFQSPKTVIDETAERKIKKMAKSDHSDISKNIRLTPMILRKSFVETVIFRDTLWSGMSSDIGGHIQTAKKYLLNLTGKALCVKQNPQMQEKEKLYWRRENEIHTLHRKRHRT